ncbi:MAG TPA: hypothetical protein VF669_17360 [Tepidisphaeraceae bacterium]
MKRALSAAMLLFVAAAPTTLPVKIETFNTDPQWESFNNRQTPPHFPTVTQDFGYDPQQQAVGGQICRTSVPAWYALKLDKPLDLNQPLSFSGSFSVPEAEGGGVYLGFFNPAALRTGGRPLGSFMLFLDGANTFVRAFTRTIAPDNQQMGALVPPAPNVKSAIPIPADGSKHRFTVTYNHHAENGEGAFTAKVGDLPPSTFTLRPGVKQQPFAMTHFGILNNQKQGSPMRVYFHDLKLNDAPIDLAKDPAWESKGNRVTFEDRHVAGFQNFGFDPARKAFGGTVWREETPSFYADNIGSLDATQPLEISGQVTLHIGAPDSAAYLAFFNADEFKRGKDENILGLLIEGPSRVGHYIRPVFLNKKGVGVEPKTGAVLPPDEKPHSFSLKFDPLQRTITVNFEGQTQTIDVAAKTLDRGAAFTHFGLFNALEGGSDVQIFFDNLRYTRAGN